MWKTCCLATDPTFFSERKKKKYGNVFTLNMIKNEMFQIEDIVSFEQLG